MVIEKKINKKCYIIFSVVDVILTTKYWGNEVSWAIFEQENCVGMCSSLPSGQYGWYSTYTEKCTLLTNTKYKLHCKDSYGDGWHGGYITIQGIRYCDEFCPDPDYCYGQGEWNPTTLPPKTGGALFIQKNIIVMEGMCAYFHILNPM